MMIMTAFPTVRTLREELAPTPLALATAAPGARSSSSSPPSSSSSATESPRRSSTRRGRWRRKRRRGRARRRPNLLYNPLLAPLQVISMSPFQNHPKQAVPHPNLPAADVDAHLGRVLRRLDDHRQQAHTSAHVQTPPPTLKML